MKIINRLLLNWIYMLCFLAGFFNAVALIKYGYAVSHFTGNITKITISIDDIIYENVYKLLMLIMFFFIGTTIAGILIDGREFNLKRRYGMCALFSGIGMLIIYFSPFFEKYMFFYLPFILGLQNGMFISYRGVVVRTTHITGSITDAGVYLGHYLKGKKEDKWKGIFCLCIIFGFLLGGIIATLLYFKIKDRVFLVGAIGYIIVAFIYFFLRYRYRHILHLTDQNYHFQ